MSLIRRLRSIGRGASRDSSASSREALEISVIKRSRRLTSCFKMVISRSRAFGSETRSRVSVAERIEDRGLRISCATSAANRSIASMRTDWAAVMASSARPRSPSSSSRSDRSGKDMARARDSLTRSAALARRRTGWAIMRIRKKDEARDTAIAIKIKGKRALRSAAMIWSTSPASSVRTPKTASTWRSGMETETRRSPLSPIRIPATDWPFRATLISRLRAWRAAASPAGLASRLEALGTGSPGLRAGGRGRRSTRSAAI